MLHGSHLMMSIGMILVLSPLIGVPITIVGIIVAAVSSLIPDIDHPKSFISHWNAFTQMISRGVSGITSHRGITHTIYGLGIWLLVVYAALNYFNISGQTPILFGAFAGYLSHLVADSFNPQGVRWLGKKAKLHISGPINTGGIHEKYFIPMLFIGMVLLYTRLL